MNTDERRARMGLCALAPMADPRLHDRVEVHGAVEVWEQLQREEGAYANRARSIAPDEIERATKACGARFVAPDDAEWPEGLTELALAQVGEQKGRPFGLWVRGAPLPGMTGGVAIVGSRAASQYGQNVALELSADLAADGIPIVSGLAYGIDVAAHRGALSVGGPTLAVVASGVDQPYPQANASVATMIARRGSIVSELPPGHSPRRPAFLARNRLIAALADGLIVVEAALRSGAKNTAAWASELGRILMAVPGPVTSPMSQTPHALIRDGQAVLVTDSRDVRELLGPFGAVVAEARRGADTALDRLPTELRELREAIEIDEEVRAGQLAHRTGLSVAACLAGLGELKERGWLEMGDGGGWRLPRAAR